MKKLLLSIAVAAVGVMGANAEQYTIFGADNYASLEWTGDANGFETTVKAGEKTFTIKTIKHESSTALIKPGDQIRVYKRLLQQELKSLLTML